MRPGFAFLTDGMETQGILLALTSKSVYMIVLWRALSFEERVSIDGQSINSSWEKAAQVCGLRGRMWVALRSKIWSYVTAVQIDWSHHPQEYVFQCTFVAYL